MRNTTKKGGKELSSKKNTNIKRGKNKKSGGLEKIIQTQTKNPKIFILDTNVILHDWKSIFKFQENDIKNKYLLDNGLIPVKSLVSMVLSINLVQDWERLSSLLIVLFLMNIKIVSQAMCPTTEFFLQQCGIETIIPTGLSVLSPRMSTLE